jgi:hypothetical protein
MLLGSTANHNASPDTESLIIQLLLQQRYAEVWELLTNQQPLQTSSLFNMALCLHWAGNYQEALGKLESIQLAIPMRSGNPLNTDNNYKLIKSKQNQTNDYLQGISESYIKSFPTLAQDAIVRLKTDCWLQLGNFAKVIAMATPIVHKGYKDITDSLKLAETANDRRI